MNLAKTLGGKNLYGQGAFSPIRELLQNAVDAVRARRTHEDREDNWGKVRLVIERDDDGVEWLHVDDEGVGMSRRVLTGPLIDFGKSLWSSNLIREEFPGLSSKNINPIGKFGIGFFSIFLLGDHVKVVSKKFNSGESETNVLEFDKLSRRPLVRCARQGELPRDFSTRVSVALSGDSIKSLSWDRPSRKYSIFGEITSSIFDRITQLVCAVDVQVEIIDKINGKTFVHTADWLTKAPEAFLSEIFAPYDREEKERIIAMHASMVRPIEGENKKIFGRAALSVGVEGNRYLPCLYAVGGFAIVEGGGGRFHEESGFSQRWRVPSEKLFGVLLGDTEDASRATAHHATPSGALADWATHQALLVDRRSFTPTQLIAFTQAVISLDGDPGSLPFAYCQGEFRSYGEVLHRVAQQDKILVPIRAISYQSQFEYTEVSRLNSDFFTVPVKPSVVVFSLVDAKLEFGDEYSRRDMQESSGRDLSEDEGASIAKYAPLSWICAHLNSAWGVKPKLAISKEALFSPSLMKGPEARWCLVLRKGQ